MAEVIVFKVNGVFVRGKEAAFEQCLLLCRLGEGPA